MEKENQIQEIDQCWDKEDSTAYDLRTSGSADKSIDNPLNKIGQVKPLGAPSFPWTNVKWKQAKYSSGLKWTIGMVTVLIMLYIFLLGYSIDEVDDEVNHASYHSYAGPVHVDAPDDASKVMRVEVRVSNVNLDKEQIDAWVYFFPSANISTPGGQLKFPISYNLKYSYGVVKEGSIMSPFETVLPILSGSNYYYPFDKFRSELMVEIIDMRTHTSLPIEIDVLVSTPSLWFDIVRVHDPDSPEIGDTLFRVLLNITRPGFVVMFCVFVVLLMWSLSLAIFGMAISLSIFSTHRPGGGYLGLGLACLFALPNLRNTQPGIPPLGVLVDVLGFFWNMILVAIASNTILITWMQRLSMESTL